MYPNLLAGKNLDRSTDISRQQQDAGGHRGGTRDRKWGRAKSSRPALRPNMRKGRKHEGDHGNCRGDRCESHQPIRDHGVLRPLAMRRNGGCIVPPALCETFVARASAGHAGYAEQSERIRDGRDLDAAPRRLRRPEEQHGHQREQHSGETTQPGSHDGRNQAWRDVTSSGRSMRSCIGPGYCAASRTPRNNASRSCREYRCPACITPKIRRVFRMFSRAGVS